MTRIGLLSDTHGYLNPQVFQYFANVDIKWHGGDFDTTELADLTEAVLSN